MSHISTFLVVMDVVEMTQHFMGLCLTNEMLFCSGYKHKAGQVDLMRDGDFLQTSPITP